MTDRRKGPDVDAYAVMTQQEVADALGISAARVGQLERRALAKVRAAMGIEEPEPGYRVDGRRYGGAAPKRSAEERQAQPRAPKRRPAITTQNTQRTPRRWRWSDLLQVSTEQRCPHCKRGVLVTDEFGNVACRRVPGVDTVRAA